MHFAVLAKCSKDEDPEVSFWPYAYESEENQEFEDCTIEVEFQYDKIKKTPGLAEVYPSIEVFNEKETCYETLTDDDGETRFGWYNNPFGFYDWCSLGGRFGNPFLVKDEISKDEELSVDSASWANLALINSLTGKEKTFSQPGPEGYHWTPVALKKNIEWEKMRETLIEDEKAKYEEYQKMLRGEKETGPWLKISGTQLIDPFDGDILCEKAWTVDEYIDHIKMLKWKYPVSTYAVHDPDRGLYGEEVGPDVERMITELIDSADDDEFIFVMDCHT